MSRPIKFRAWDSGIGMFEPDFINKEGYAVTNDGMGGLTVMSKEIMQFTGLHDIAKKEIWEGDVIEWFNLLVADGKQTGRMVREEVKFTPEGLYRVHCLKSDHNIKVLGNIYENPELLK